MVLLSSTTWTNPEMAFQDAKADAASANLQPDRDLSAIDDAIVRRALELIWTHSHEPLSVSDIARQLPVTRRTLDRRFAEATGHSVLEEINACRLSRAKRLLSETELPVKTIARQAGYSSTERMRVAFVEREGTSPTLFRKRMAEARERAKRPGNTEAAIDAQDQHVPKSENW